MSISTILLLVGVILLACQSAGVTAPRVSLGWLGLTLWTLSQLVPGLR